MKQKRRSLVEESDRYGGKPAFIVGNALTRADYDINQLKGKGLIIGCNRFGEHYDLRDCHSLLALSDPDITKWCGSRAWYTKFEFILMPLNRDVPHKRGKPVIPYDRIRCGPPLKKGELTGDHCVRTAIDLGCSPVFLIGFGGPLTEVAKNVYSDNMYERTSGEHKHKKGIRTYSESHEISRAVSFTGGRRIQELDCLNPNKIFRVGEIGFDFLDYVTWDSLLKALR